MDCLFFWPAPVIPLSSWPPLPPPSWSRPRRPPSSRPPFHPPPGPLAVRTPRSPSPARRWDGDLLPSLLPAWSHLPRPGKQAEQRNNNIGNWFFYFLTKTNWKESKGGESWFHLFRAAKLHTMVMVMHASQEIVRRMSRLTFRITFLHLQSAF